MPDKTKQEILDEMVKDFNKKTSEMEQKLVDFALEHELHLSIGNYGSGRTLLLEKDSYYAGKERGDWIYSSETC